MRNRTIEAAMILGVGAMTTLAVGSYIHGLNAGGQSAFDASVNRAFGSVGQWIQSLKSSSPMSNQTGTSKLTTARLNANARSVATAPVSPLTASVFDQTAANDVSAKRLFTIAQTLATRLTSSDWARIAVILKDSSATDGYHQLLQIFDQHLSVSDSSWLSSQLAQSPSTSDFAVLQSVLDGVGHSLTPLQQASMIQQMVQIG